MVTDENTGELFCGRCGFVVTDKIADTGAEWRSFASDDNNRTRVGAGATGSFRSLAFWTRGCERLSGSNQAVY